jgi:hypothetical protein
MKVTKRLIVGVALAMSMAIIPGSVSAAHCVAPVGEASSPGFSYFGRDHVQESTHAEGGNPGPHAGTSGASNCRGTTGSPSERAPRQV